MTVVTEAAFKGYNAEHQWKVVSELTNEDGWEQSHVSCQNTDHYSTVFSAL